jgi:DNA-binding NarL/FixJ family response regulator
VATNIVLNNLETEPYGLVSRLTTRELQVLRQISIGSAIPDIAEDLFMSEKTVRGYRSKLLKKLDLENDVQLSDFALQHGLRE